MDITKLMLSDEGKKLRWEVFDSFRQIYLQGTQKEYPDYDLYIDNLLTKAIPIIREKTLSDLQAILKDAGDLRMLERQMIDYVETLERELKEK